MFIPGPESITCMLVDGPIGPPNIPELNRKEPQKAELRTISSPTLSRFREADSSFGRSAAPFSYAVIFKNIERKFQAPTYFIKKDKFRELVFGASAGVDRPDNSWQTQPQERDSELRRFRGIRRLSLFTPRTHYGVRFRVFNFSGGVCDSPQWSNRVRKSLMGRTWAEASSAISKMVAQPLSEGAVNLPICLNNVRCSHLLPLFGRTENPCVECSIHSLPTKNSSSVARKSSETYALNFHVAARLGIAVVVCLIHVQFVVVSFHFCR